MSQAAEIVSLGEATRSRYLSYALSVITSRALPDVRDGLKPVQRRILYAMFNNLKLHPTGRFRKSAAVVGAVMARFHPHGDQAIYDAMVRMAQSFALRHPLVNGQGNFGSLDGDPPAAMRYTEAKLQAVALELLTELPRKTVDFTPSYDGQAFEPRVLPARLPFLLINGSEGIAVGMATRIPPHSLREIVDACLVLLADPEAPLSALLKKVKGPDFPTGGQLCSTPREIEQIYREGRGSVVLRGQWTTEKSGRKSLLVLTSIPYSLNKSNLVEAIAQLVAQRKLPQVLDVRDESTDEVRIVLEMKSKDHAQRIVAFLCKHTDFEKKLHANLTALLPPETEEGSGIPQRLGLREILTHWIAFRRLTVRRRFHFELTRLLNRIHILTGFEKIFDALDEALTIIRESSGRRAANEALMDRFDLDDDQADAILDLKLYRLSRLEIGAIQEELAESRAEAARIQKILDSPEDLTQVLRDELKELRQQHGEPRRTQVGDFESMTYKETDYIEIEDCFVMITRGGWIKRQSSFSEVSKIRVREQDEIRWIIKASTRSTLTFFSDQGKAFTLLVDSVPSTTGHGDPIQRHFQLAADEALVAVLSHDARHQAKPLTGEEGPSFLAVSRSGKGLRLPMSRFAAVSKTTGRRYLQMDAADRVLTVELAQNAWCTLASRGGNVLAFTTDQLPLLQSPGKGNSTLSLREGDQLLALEQTSGLSTGVKVSTQRGRELVVTPQRFEGSRGARGSRVSKKEGFVNWIRESIIYLGEASDDQKL